MTWGTGNGVSAPVRFPVGDVVCLSPMESGSLGDYYREHGESDHLARLEAALPAGWLPTREVTVAAGVAVGAWSRRALEYLFEEGRAEKRLAPGRRSRPRWEWRRPG